MNQALDKTRNSAKGLKTVINTGLRADDGGATSLEGIQLDSYRTMTKLVQRAVVLLGVVILVLAGVLLYNVKNRVADDRFFAVAAGAGKMQMVGLRNPYLNNAAVTAWISTAAASVMTFGFNDMEARFAENSKLFTPEGWKSFRKAIDNEGGLTESVINNQQIITSIAQAPPTFVFVGYKMGRYSWIIDIPVSMTIRAGNKSVTRVANVRATLVELPTKENPMGIGIDTWFSS